MASHRTSAAHAAISATHPGATRQHSTASKSPAAGETSLKCAALYARVSTEKQEREDTVASQVDLLYKAAATSGYDISPTNVFIDEGISGSRLDRPALDRLRDLVAEGAFEVLLVTVPDRLARRYAYQVLLVEEFHRCGCEVVFVQSSLGASPEEQMLLQMQGVFAEYERALIQERTRRGRLFAARQGRVNWGNPPYGYTYVRKTLTTPQHLVINEVEAEIVRLIYRWCVQEQMSSYAIQKRLSAQGIRPRKARHGRWAQSSIIEILRDSLYKGEAYYNRTQAGRAANRMVRVDIKIVSPVIDKVGLRVHGVNGLRLRCPRLLTRRHGNRCKSNFSTIRSGPGAIRSRAGIFYGAC